MKRNEDDAFFCVVMLAISISGLNKMQNFPSSERVAQYFYKMDWQLTCRVCLESGDMVSLFDWDENNEQLADKYTYCCGVEVAKTDSLPTLICLNCVDRLTFSYQFKQQCLASNDTLKECLSSAAVAEAGSSKRDNDYLRELLGRQLAAQNVDTPLDEATEEPSASSATATPSSIEENTLFIWSNACVLLLLSLYEENKEEFESGKRHKKVFDLIAQRMKEINERYDLTGAQCQSKLNGLKRTYKNILDHNKISGNNRETWPFFDRMHEIFGGNGWAKPRALASSNHQDVPAEPTTPKTINIPKKKDLIEKTLKEMREEKSRRVLEKEKYHKEKEERKEGYKNKLIEMKERHHAEKLKLIERLLTNRQPPVD